MVKTKILCTIGPASYDKIEKLVDAGMDGVRINLSHVQDYNFFKELIFRIRKDFPNIFIVADIEGPKIRLGNFEKINVSKGQQVIISPSNECPNGCIPIHHDSFYQFVREGTIILIADGTTGLKVIKVDGKNVLCSVEWGEALEPRKGVNTPGLIIPMPYLSEKDKKNIEFCKEVGVDYISASFVRSADDIKEVKSLIDGTNIKVIAKIENHQSIEHFDYILEETDAVMVARGDLGIEIGVYRVPHYQKEIITKCNKLGKTVITATQMLESMMNSKEPKRAEVSDIFNAVLDGTDVVMLSGETSLGKYPVEAVYVMNETLNEAERHLFLHYANKFGEKIMRNSESDNTSESISEAVYAASKTDYIDAIITPTSSGYTTRMISRFRINKPIFAVTTNPFTMRQTNAIFGVISVLIQNEGDDVVEKSIFAVKNAGLIKPGQHVIITAGLGSFGKGRTNVMRIERVQ